MKEPTSSSGPFGPTDRESAPVTAGSAAGVDACPDGGVVGGGVVGGRYELVERIGTGRWTTVWRGRDRQLERPVAVKIVYGPDDIDRRVFDRFHREAVVAASLEHRNVVRLYDFGRQDRSHHLVMEYAVGGSLQQADTWHASPELVTAVGFQAAAGLGAVHAKGLVHRDIKPSNLLLGDGGLLKVSDMGIARRIHRETTLDSGDDLLGTARYLAPEQVDGQSAVPSSDVFSLGLVLWELWTGRPAYRRETAAATALARLYSDLPPPSSIRPGIPEGLESAVVRATARSPEVRFRHGWELHQALASLTNSRQDLALDISAGHGQPTEPRQTPPSEATGEQGTAGG